MRPSLPRRALLALLPLLLLPSSALAQITVGADDYDARLGQTYSLDLVVPADTVEMQTFARMAGPDQTFDFTTLDLSTALPLQVDYMPLPADVPGSDLDEFARANHVLRVAPRMPIEDGVPEIDAAFWLYRGTTPNGVGTHGFFIDLGLSALDSLNLPDSLSLPDSLGLPDSLLEPFPFPLDSLVLADTLLAYSSPPLRTLALPLAANSSWTSSSIMAAEWGEILVLLTTSLEAEVDGYGTLVTPDGTAACLRLHSTYTLQVPLTEFRLAFEVVQYVTDERLSAFIVLDEAGTPLVAGHGNEIGPSSAEPTPTTSQLTLGPATPHPFRQSTMLHYTLARPSHVRLRLFDVLGREVTTLVDASQPAGPHDVRLDAADLPAGLYVAHLEAGDTVSTRTLIRTR